MARSSVSSSSLASLASRALASLALVSLAASCELPAPPFAAPCVDDGDCDDGYVCFAAGGGVCVRADDVVGEEGEGEEGEGEEGEGEAGEGEGEGGEGEGGEGEGELVLDVDIATGGGALGRVAGQQAGIDIACGAAGCLAIWLDQRRGTGNDVFAARLDVAELANGGGGVVDDTGLLIVPTTSERFVSQAQVAAASDGFVVVTASSVSGVNGQVLEAVHVDALGNVAPLGLASTFGTVFHLDVACRGDDCFVVVDTFFGDAAASRDLRGFLVATGAGPFGGVPLATGPGEQMEPSIAATSTGWSIAYTQRDDATGIVDVRQVDVSVDLVAGADVAVASSNLVEQTPGIASDVDAVVVAYTEDNPQLGTVMRARFDSPLPLAHDLGPAAASAGTSPGVATDGGNVAAVGFLSPPGADGTSALAIGLARRDDPLSVVSVDTGITGVQPFFGEVPLAFAGGAFAIAAAIPEGGFDRALTDAVVAALPAASVTTPFPAIGEPAPLSVALPRQLGTTLARSGDELLVLWSEDAGGAPGALFALRLDATGAPLDDAPLVVANESDGVVVGFLSAIGIESGFLVAYAAFQVNNPTFSGDIFGVVVPTAASGDAVGDSALLVDPPGFPIGASMATSGDVAVVTYRDEVVTAGLAEAEVRAARFQLAPFGFIDDVLIDTVPRNSPAFPVEAPVVTFHDGDFTVAWLDTDGVRAAVVPVDGSAPQLVQAIRSDTPARNVAIAGGGGALCVGWLDVTDNARPVPRVLVQPVGGAAVTRSALGETGPASPLTLSPADDGCFATWRTGSAGRTAAQLARFTAGTAGAPRTLFDAVDVLPSAIVDVSGDIDALLVAFARFEQEAGGWRVFWRPTAPPQ